MKAIRLGLALLALLLVAPTGAATQEDPTGEWLVAKRVARIRIINCDNKFWGYLSWEEQAGIDSNNPDPDKRSRPTLGMPILLGMTQSKANEWKGEIYNAQDGRKYSSNISLLNPDTLKVQGCVLGILCGGENWTRVGMQTPIAPPPAKKSTTPKNPAKNPDEALCQELPAAAGLSH